MPPARCQPVHDGGGWVPAPVMGASPNDGCQHQWPDVIKSIRTIALRRQAAFYHSGFVFIGFCDAWHTSCAHPDSLAHPAGCSHWVRQPPGGGATVLGVPRNIEPVRNFTGKDLNDARHCIDMYNQHPLPHVTLVGGQRRMPELFKLPDGRAGAVG